MSESAIQGHELSSTRDHISSLPPELLHIILSYLFAHHDPDRPADRVTNDKLRLQPKHVHTLDSLAATCKYLRSEVMGFALRFLTEHGDITGYKSLKTAKLQMERNMLRGRGGLLSWAEKHCVFCGKGSKRQAILMNGLTCCDRCDRTQWPGKITRTAARTEYWLKDHHLLPHRFPPNAEGINLPRIRHGSYLCVNVPTMMFSRADVERVATMVHGDLPLYLSQKQAELGKRREKREEKRKKLAEENCIVID